MWTHPAFLREPVLKRLLFSKNPACALYQTQPIVWVTFTMTDTTQAGVLAPDHGSIAFADRRIDGRPPEEMCRRGIARTFQLIRPFSGLTVEDNVIVGAILRCADMTAALRGAHEVLWQVGLF